MSTFDKRRGGSAIPGWLIALGIVWGLASLVGLFFVGRKIIGVAKRQHEVQLHGVGPAERALFLTPDELVQGGLWHPTRKAPREAEIKTVSAAGSSSMMATLHGVEHNSTVIEMVVPRSGPSWITEPVMHQSARFVFLKQGFDERTDPPIGPDHYSTYRYCKGDDCPTRVVLGTLEQSGIYLTMNGNAPLDDGKIAAMVKTNLERVAAYEKTHNAFDDDGGSP